MEKSKHFERENNHTASRNFINVSQIVEEYDKTTENTVEYELIDDPLCDLDDTISAMENCRDCEYFYDCMQLVK